MQRAACTPSSRCSGVDLIHHQNRAQPGVGEQAGHGAQRTGDIAGRRIGEHLRPARKRLRAGELRAAEHSLYPGQQLRKCVAVDVVEQGGDLPRVRNRGDVLCRVPIEPRDRQLADFPQRRPDSQNPGSESDPAELKLAGRIRSRWISSAHTTGIGMSAVATSRCTS